ncbi:potassium/sodium hyperpolarization-activated cyclic nucleotide-gated channel 4-like isoform X2 [Dermacentor silvarum]|uniref:potassium/sodium hyperpolarization-activated cyclic nucleotide-gated channel 4-like isoform X2 n=1 Tax=Dermacentor silvarum TaxID=543639 RepID=UPI002101A4FA|nr:potassium/sodium hyperpolarization-activated cyclic nucleotide-gated channel 4-like isoform X2 [Dermacentor silvarum]
MVVILWRVYILKRARDQIRRQRRQAAEAFSNPSLVTSLAVASNNVRPRAEVGVSSLTRTTQPSMCEGTGVLPAATSRDGRERPFVLATPRNELPPPYDEAIKYPSLDWTNSGCELPTLRAPVLDSGGGGIGPALPAPQQPLPEPSRPPVPPRPSRAPPARPSAQVDSSASPDAADLPTYEELQRRGTVPNPELVLAVGSHMRNQSA